MEDINDFFENLKVFLDNLKDLKDICIKLIKLSELYKFPNEMKNFRLDLEKYNLGVFLWCKEEYPNISEIFSSLEIFPQIFTIKKAKNIINQYFYFIEKIQQKYSVLLNEEIVESKKLFFDSTIKPIEIKIKKDALSQFVNDESIKLINKFKDYLPKVGDLAKSYLNSTKSCNSLESKIKTIGDIKFPPETKNLVNVITSMGKKIEEISEIKNRDPSKEIYKLLILIKDFDVYNINFTKFINRLYHIFEQGNRDFKRKNKKGIYKSQYYSIEYTYPSRIKLKNFLKDNFSQQYPQLSRIFCVYLALFAKFRNIDAHESPDKIKFTKNKKYAIIKRIGIEKNSRMNIIKMRKITNTYIAFMEAIGTP